MLTLSQQSRIAFDPMLITGRLLSKKKPVSQVAGVQILCHGDPSLGLRVRQWKVDFDTFRNIIMASRDSAPGPDGIPYSAWKIAPLHVLEALHLCYSSWIDYGALPHGFGHSYLWLLPEGDDPNENDGIMLRSPEQTRPLSGANTDSRMFATCLRRSIEDAVCEWAHPFQRGFLRGRNILEHVLEIEKFTLLAHL